MPSKHSSNLSPESTSADQIITTLAFTSELTPERAADVIFGDTALLVDWLSGIASVVPMISLSTETPYIVRFEAERLYRLRVDAAKNIENVFKLAMGKPSGFMQELEKVRKGLGCFDEAGRIAYATGAQRTISDGDRPTREALWDTLEDRARELERMRAAFKAEIQADLDGLDGLQRQQLNQAQQFLTEGLPEAPLDRSRILRDSRRLFREVTSELGASLSCAVWAQYCWLTWQLTANEEETMIPLEFAVSQASSATGPGKALCARLYAYLLCRLERFDEAYQWSYAAAGVWPNVETFHERARYAVLTGRIEVARKELDALVRTGPLGIILAYADPVTSMLAADLLEGTVREQMRLRQVARQEISAWESVVRKTVEVRRRVPSINLPNDLTDGVDSTKSENDQAHFLIAAHQVRKSSSAKEDLKALTAAALQAEKRRRTEAIQLARTNIEAALDGRDRWIKASLSAHEEALNGVRSVLSQSDSKGDAAQKGCGWGMSMGCAILVGYSALAFALSVRGIMIGPSTGWGMLMLSLAALPIVIALMYQLVYSAKRMMLDAQVNTQITVSNEKYEKSREEANEQFRGMIESSQELLATEEKLLLRVEDAIRVFG